jgi:hypothetical protein
VFPFREPIRKLESSASDADQWSTWIVTKGTFWFFAAVTLLGLGFVWFFLPETAGKSLEGMDEMFNLPWHIIGRKGAELTKGKGSVSEAMALGENEKGVDIEGAQPVEDVDPAAKRN